MNELDFKRRNSVIAIRYMYNETARSLAVEHRVTIERVRQIVLRLSSRFARIIGNDDLANVSPRDFNFDTQFKFLMYLTDCCGYDVSGHDVEVEQLDVDKRILEIIKDAPILLKNTLSLDLTVRSTKCLKVNGIEYIGDLVQMTEVELLKIPHMGKGSVSEIKDSLYKLGFTLNVSLTGGAGRISIKDHLDSGPLL